MVEQSRESVENPTPLRVVAAVIEENGKVLACRRAPGKDAPGLWEFPGGKVEIGEHEVEALVREIQEELGAQILVQGEFCRDITVVDGRSIELICLRARFRGDRPTESTDHDAMVWLPVAELHQLSWAEPDIPAVSRLIHEI